MRYSRAESTPPLGHLLKLGQFPAGLRHFRLTKDKIAGKASFRDSSDLEIGGEGWIRTSVRLRGQIYSLLPLTTRPPLHEAPATGRAFRQARHMAAHHCCVNAGEREELSPRSMVAGASRMPVPPTG